MRALLFDMCVDRRHTAPAFLAFAEGSFITDWLAADASDTDVLALSRSLGRILVTEDADFGDLVFRDRLPAPPGVVLVMTQLILRDERALRLPIFAKRALAKAEGAFVVAGPNRVRFRPPP